MARASFESDLTEVERESIRRGVRQGIEDIEAGRYKEYDATGLKALAKKLAAASSRKLLKRDIRACDEGRQIERRRT